MRHDLRIQPRCIWSGKCCYWNCLSDMQGPIYKAIEWLDHQGMELIEQVSLSLVIAVPLS